MKKQILSTLTAILLITAAIVNIRCEAEKRNKIERQAQFQYYLHINSKPYKKCLEQDTLFAQRLDSIDKERIERAKVNKNTTHKPYMPK